MLMTVGNDLQMSVVHMWLIVVTSVSHRRFVCHSLKSVQVTNVGASDQDWGDPVLPPVIPPLETLRFQRRSRGAVESLVKLVWNGNIKSLNRDRIPAA